MASWVQFALTFPVTAIMNLVKAATFSTSYCDEPSQSSVAGCQYKTRHKFYIDVKYLFCCPFDPAVYKKNIGLMAEVLLLDAFQQ